jgi:hypothetical protein
VFAWPIKMFDEQQNPRRIFAKKAIRSPGDSNFRRNRCLISLKASAKKNLRFSISKDVHLASKRQFTFPSSHRRSSRRIYAIIGVANSSGNFISLQTQHLFIDVNRP